MLYSCPGQGQAPASALPDEGGGRELLLLGGEVSLGPGGRPLQDLQLVRLWGKQQQLQEQGEVCLQVWAVTLLALYCTVRDEIVFNIYSDQ